MAIAWTLIAAPLVALITTAAPALDGPAKSPDQDLPPHITRLTHFGERADFSHDGKRVLFVEKTFGDVYEIELATRAIRLLTGHYKHLGYTRLSTSRVATSCFPAPIASTRRTRGQVASSASCTSLART